MSDPRFNFKDIEVHITAVDVALGGVEGDVLEGVLPFVDVHEGGGGTSDEDGKRGIVVAAVGSARRFRPGQW